MKQRIRLSRLVLSRTVLRRLTEEELAGVLGGTADLVAPPRVTASCIACRGDIVVAPEPPPERSATCYPVPQGSRVQC